MITETKLAGRRKKGARELRLTKKVTADKEGAGPRLSRIAASGGGIRENQHEEDRMRDIHVGKRGSVAAGEEH